MLCEIAESQGLHIKIGKYLKGGQTFGQHMGIEESRKARQVRGYDYAFLQDQSRSHYDYYTLKTPALKEDTKAVGFTIVPTLVFIDDKGRAKMDIALCKGKKEYDKRQTLKEKEDRREMDRAMKVYK